MNEIATCYDLSTLHTFQLPAKAESILFLTRQEQLADIPADAYVIGGGSNTIFLSDFKRPLVCIRIAGIEIIEDEKCWHVTVGAGENWHQLVLHLHDKGINGFENLALIPGTVGAAPVQNIGAYGREVAEFIHSVRAWDRQQRKLVTLKSADCKFGYRDSIFKHDPMRWIILQVEFSMPKAWQPELSYGELKALENPISATDILNKVIAIRTEKLPDPAMTPNAGSFFKNPVVSKDHFAELIQRFPSMPYFELTNGKVKLAAGWLIDQLNLKGFAIGGAAVHTKQALVLVNKGDASGQDVFELASHIQKLVFKHYGIELEAEVRLLNEKGLISL